MRRVLFLCIGYLVLLVGVSGLAQTPSTVDAPIKRILIVGDSWAASIAAVNHDGTPGFGTFDAVLAATGLGRFSTQGAVTAWGGRKASDWAKPENLAAIAQELAAYPTIDIVHLVVGGNDFLNKAAGGKNIMTYSPQEREKFWAGIQGDIRMIVNHCLAQRPGIRVLICDYDYLDAEKAHAAYPHFDFGGATPRQVNEAFIELGRKKLELARQTPQCAYVSNWGVLQHHYGVPKPGLPLPGGPPDYAPYAGGDLDAPMPPAAHVGDGVHPTDQAHRYMLQRCVDRFYRAWLTAKTVAII